MKKACIIFNKHNENNWDLNIQKEFLKENGNDIFLINENLNYKDLDDTISILLERNYKDVTLLLNSDDEDYEDLKESFIEEYDILFEKINVESEHFFRFNEVDTTQTVSNSSQSNNTQNLPSGTPISVEQNSNESTTQNTSTNTTQTTSNQIIPLELYIMDANGPITFQNFKNYVDSFKKLNIDGTTKFIGIPYYDEIVNSVFLSPEQLLTIFRMYSPSDADWLNKVTIVVPCKTDIKTLSPIFKDKQLKLIVPKDSPYFNIYTNLYSKTDTTVEPASFRTFPIGNLNDKFKNLTKDILKDVDNKEFTVDTTKKTELNPEMKALINMMRLFKNFEKTGKRPYTPDSNRSSEFSNINQAFKTFFQGDIDLAKEVINQAGFGLVLDVITLAKNLSKGDSNKSNSSDKDKKERMDNYEKEVGKEFIQYSRYILHPKFAELFKLATGFDIKYQDVKTKLTSEENSNNEETKNTEQKQNDETLKDFIKEEN